MSESPLKEAEKEASGSKIESEKDELTKLREENAILWKQNRAHKAEIERRRREKLEKESKELDNPTPKVESPPKVEHVHSTEQKDEKKSIHCDTCGKDMPSEVQCNDCGYKLGSVEHAKQIGDCPQCHSKKAVVIEELKV